MKAAAWISSGSGRAGVALLLALTTSWAMAADWLIASDDGSAIAGAETRFEVVRPGSENPWPERLKLTLGEAQTSMELRVEPGAADAVRRGYRGMVPAQLSGLIWARLAEFGSNRLALVVARPDVLVTMGSAEEGDGKGVGPDRASAPAGTETLFQDNEPALSLNEPMYFVLGHHDGTTARFQFSFKYRLLDPGSLPVSWLPALSRLHFGYTQTVLWDLGEESSPFHDTSYRPSLFWQGRIPENPLGVSLLRAGYEHESNGRDGLNSRSIDTLIVAPVWEKHFVDGRSLVVSPKFYGYLDKEDNPDIQRYRGYADWSLRYGREDGWVASALLRRGTGGYGSAQLDLSYPLRQPLFARAGGFLHFQLFRGYGESLLDYNLDRGTRFRVGFSIVR